MTASVRTAGLLLAVLSAVAFSFKAIFVKLGLAHGADAVTLLALRMGFALPVFLVMAWRAGAAGLTRRDWLWLAALGLCYAGIGLAVSHDLTFAGASRDLVVGSLWVFASAVSYALFWMGSGHVVARIGAARLSAFASIFACLFVLGHFAVTHPLAALAVPPRVYLDGLALALLCTVLPIWLQAEAIRRVGAPTAALVGTLGPVVTIFLGWWILGEAMSASQLAGAALVIAGVLLVSLKKRQRRPAAADLSRP